MPRVIDASVAVQEERGYPYAEKTTPLSAVAELGDECTRFLAALWSAVTSLLPQHARLQPQVAYSKQRFELPIDRIAREHPFLYIKSMSG
jgi:hypothetical protein